MRSDASPPVAVIACSVIAPGAVTPEQLDDVLQSGKVLAEPVVDFDVTDYPAKLCSTAATFDPSVHLSHPEIRRMPRAVQMIVAAGCEALAAAGDGWRQFQPDLPIVVGTGIGGLTRFEDASDILHGQGYRRVSPLTVPMIMPNAAAAELALRVGSHAPTLTVAGACASSSMALAQAVHMIRGGRARVVLAGGGESLLRSLIFAAFTRTDAMAPGPDQPRGPFDVNRAGFVMGEGAGFAMLCDLETCERAGFEPIAQILGVGESTDSFHVVAPEPEGAGAALSMTAALADAGVHPGEIGHVTAHATATPVGDLSEARAIHTVFGPEPPPVAAHKGSLGHLIGGSGVVSTIAAWRSAQSGLVPPVAGLRDIDPETAVPAVVGAPEPIDAGQPALVNAFAFGGHNVTLVVR